MVAVWFLFKKGPSKLIIQSLDSSYLQTRIDGDLFAAKDRKLERLFVIDSSIPFKNEEVNVSSPVPEGSYYSFIGSYENKLVTAYDNSPVIEIFESNHLTGARSMSTISLDEGVCPGCSSLDKILINNGQLLYTFSTSERASPNFYYAVDLTTTPIEAKQITEEEWNNLANK